MLIAERTSIAHCYQTTPVVEPRRTSQREALGEIPGTVSHTTVSDARDMEGHKKDGNVICRQSDAEWYVKGRT